MSEDAAVFTLSGADTLFRVRVQPKASRNALLAGEGGRVRVALMAPPVEGAANEALVKYVAGLLGIPRRRVTLESGAQSREKVLRLGGLSPAEAARLLGMGRPKD